MTKADMLALGKTMLAEYEPTLNVLGDPVEPCGKLTVAKSTIKGSLDPVDEKTMRLHISKVLDELAAAKNGFRMSEPDLMLASLYKVDTVLHGQLMLSFVTMCDATAMEFYNHAVCWYYPV